MTYHRVLSILIIAAPILLASGCLTVEFKEYRIRLKSDHAGEATIRFVNIMSEADDTVDISEDDFNQLIEFYVEGEQPEKDNPGYRNVKKRLFEENGVLCGEIAFSFDSLSTVRLFQYDDESPYMYAIAGPLSSEHYVESNGVTVQPWMPVVFWSRESSEFYIKTKVVSEVSFQRNLVKHFRAWLAHQQTEQKHNKP
jgi:hypothetical protein